MRPVCSRSSVLCPLQLDVSGVADGQALHDYPAHDYNVFTEPGACDYHSEPYTWTNSNADQGFTLNLDAPYSSYSAINVADGQSLGRGPEFYNNMAAPNNCVGGSETSCPATDPVPPAAPAHWYANGHNISIADGQSLGRGPEFYNNMEAPNNCVGGSETSCPATDPVPPPPPAHWYANGQGVSIADGQSLRGAEFYNCDSCSKNCVGGSEGSCIPKVTFALCVLVRVCVRARESCRRLAVRNALTEGHKTERARGQSRPDGRRSQRICLRQGCFGDQCRRRPVPRPRPRVLQQHGGAQQLRGRLRDLVPGHRPRPARGPGPLVCQRAQRLHRRRPEPARRRVLQQLVGARQLRGRLGDHLLPAWLPCPSWPRFSLPPSPLPSCPPPGPALCPYIGWRRSLT